MSADRRAPAYFDSSILVKRYVDEGGSAQARRLMLEHRIVSSIIARAEAMSAIRRRLGTEIDGEAFAGAIARLRRDRDYWETVPIDSMVIEQAEELLLSSTVRTLDALHVASAVVFQSKSAVPVPFVTADKRQRDAARSVLGRVIWVDPGQGNYAQP